MVDDVQKLEQKQPVALRIPILASVALAAIAVLPVARDQAVVLVSILSSSAMLLVWALLLWNRVRVTGRRLEAVTVIRKPHYVQLIVQIFVYAYWGWYWREVYAFAPLIVAQIFFAYAFDGLLSWSRRDNWQFGFGPFPIILSTNLFLWFRPEWFYLQFLMIAVGFLGKEFITWEKGGRRAHIFNPSALTLFIFSIILLVTGSTDISWGLEVATTLVYPEHIYLEIFLLGLVVQFLFGVTLTTLGAAAMLVALNLLYTQVTGVYFFLDSTIPIAVFLGLHLLVTDPATSPRTELGRAVFGALYGLGVFVLFWLLEYLGQPSFYDKLLCVPLLNMSVRALDRMATSLAKRVKNIDQLGMAGTAKNRNLVYMAVWIALFAGMHMSGLMQKHHPGARPEFWRAACDEQKLKACRNLFTIYSNNCDTGDGASCNSMALLLNEQRNTPEAHMMAATGFIRACELGETAGCKNGLIQYFGDRNSMQSVEAQNLAAGLAQNCANGDGEACYLLGFGVERGSISVVPGSTAGSLYEQACNLNEPRGCSGLANRLVRGADGSPDPVSAARYLRRACDLGQEDACEAIDKM